MKGLGYRAHRIGSRVHGLECSGTMEHWPALASQTCSVYGSGAGVQGFLAGGFGFRQTIEVGVYRVEGFWLRVQGSSYRV